MRYFKWYTTLVAVCTLSCSSVLLASGGFSPSMGGKKSEGFNRGKAIVYGKAGIPGCRSCHESWKRGDVKKFMPQLDAILSDSSAHEPPLGHSYSADEKSAITEYLKTRYRIR